MKMKIVALAVLFVLLVPGLNAFAFQPDDYKKGLLDTEIYTKSSDKFDVIFDNDPVTTTSNKPTISFTFVDLQEINFIYYDGTLDHHVFKFYDASNNLLATVGPFENVSVKKYIDISAKNLENVKRVELVHDDSIYSRVIREIDFFTSDPDVFVKIPVGQLEETTTYKSIELHWTNPEIEHFEGAVISQDGQVIARITPDKNSYTVEGLEHETAYNFEVLANYGEYGYSEPRSKTITTSPLPPVDEVTGVNAETTHERVDLSWNLPGSELFEHVNIYRDEINEVAFFDQVFGVRTVSAASTKIFETNGTYFNDLTVTPEKEYEYTLTTTDSYGRESNGVTVTTETEEEPTPEIIGGDYTKDPTTGDFVYSWQEPTEGQVKVFLDGTEYKTVDSAVKKVVIPAAEMKYDSLGDPLISLQPVGKYGTAGEITQTGSTVRDITLPFSPFDLLKSGNSLFMTIGGFLLLAISFLLVPKLIRMIKRALGKESEKEAAARRIKEEEKARKTERREREKREAREARQAKGTTATAAPATAQGVSKATVTERQEKKIKETVTKTAQKEPRMARERKREGRQPKATREPRERTRATRAPRNGRR